MATFIKIDGRAAAILGLVGSVIAAFAIAPEASMGFVQSVLDQLGGLV